jgi:hypothetical protein
VTYLLKKESIGQLHEQVANGYSEIISERIREAIKNEAINFKFNGARRRYSLSLPMRGLA